MAIRFFLGANSPKGFVSYYEDWVHDKSAARFFIIKGTPGNGKSTFMRRIGASMKKRGIIREEILCSADPNSLDGVFFPELRVGIVDGTAPHILEPKYPLGLETYLPLTQFVNDMAVFGQRESVIELSNIYLEEYSRLYRILSAVKSLRDEQRNLIFTHEVFEKIARRTQGIIKREIKKCDTRSPEAGRVNKRFLSALTENGWLVLWDTVHAMCERVYELEDNYHNGHCMLSGIFNAALERGLLIYACHDPMEPSRLAHVILPELKLAFVTSSATAPYPEKPFRRIRLDACAPAEAVQSRRHRLRFLQKTERALIADACEILSNTGKIHDEIENIYNPHVDFTSLLAMASAYEHKILLDWRKKT
ncbi:MAG: hypothetical protein FWH04_01600 [Oscillospiraceae bacterium]|nr:hypothetical protein [Oscillospiraceae bacterium]